MGIRNVVAIEWDGKRVELPRRMTMYEAVGYASRQARANATE